MSKKTKITLLACFVLISFAVVGVYYQGPRSETTLACSMCGKQKLARKRVWITYYAKESETDDSRWYLAKGMRKHRHDYQYVCSNEKGWGKSGIHIDGFGPFLYPLHVLRWSEQKADPIIFEELIEQYYATREEKNKMEDFVKRCQAIIDSNEPLHRAENH